MTDGAASAGRLLIRCEFTGAALDERAARRAAHLAHVAANAHRIAYGGLLGEADGPPIGVCYVLVADDPEEGRRFVADDPYRPLYATIAIEPLQQRFPPPEDAS
ncbi:MAG: YciI family protein [Acidimicrobiales bacterium]